MEEFKELESKRIDLQIKLDKINKQIMENKEIQDESQNPKGIFVFEEIDNLIRKIKFNCECKSDSPYKYHDNYCYLPYITSIKDRLNELMLNIKNRNITMEEVD